MKKFICIILSIISLSSVMLMGGCSDFDFNPIGKWRLTDDIVYYDGVEAEHEAQDDMIYETYYVFEKCGTGYILVCDQMSDTRTLEFTYEYDNQDIVVTFTNISNDGTQPTEKFTVSGDRTQIVDTTASEYTDEDGNIVQISEDIVLKKV